MVRELKQAIDPFPVHVKGEKIAVSAAFVLFGLVALGILGLLGSLIYVTLNAPRPTAKLTLKRPGKTTKPPAPTIPKSTAVSPALEGLAGIWYADMATSWSEARIEPTGGKEFRVWLQQRSEQGTRTGAASGELSDDAKTLNWESPEGLSFHGSVPETGAPMAGTFAGAGTAKFVRLADVPLTVYTDPQAVFSVDYPAGWKSREGADEASRWVEFSPVGAPEVFFRVRLQPLPAGQSVVQAFQDQEAVLSRDAASGGMYKRLSLDEHALLAGSAAVAWEYQHQRSGGPATHGLTYGTAQGEQGVFLESAWPVDQEEVWAPLLERMRTTFRLSQ
jgi:hypothetical protein